MNEDRLAFLFRSPLIVEAAVRAALAQSLAIRRMCRGEIDARAFGNRTLDELRAELGRRGEAYDALGKYELEVVAVRAASRLFSSRIGRRLLTIDPERFESAPSESDAVVRDEHGRVHVVRIEASDCDERRVELGRTLTRAAEARPSVHVPRIHFFSLRDGRLRSFSFARHRSNAAA